VSHCRGTSSWRICRGSFCRHTGRRRIVHHENVVSSLFMTHFPCMRMASRPCGGCDSSAPCICCRERLPLASAPLQNIWAAAELLTGCAPTEARAAPTKVVARSLVFCDRLADAYFPPALAFSYDFQNKPSKLPQMASFQCRVNLFRRPRVPHEVPASFINAQNTRTRIGRESST